MRYFRTRKFRSMGLGRIAWRLGRWPLGAILITLVPAFFLAGSIYEYRDTVDMAHLAGVDAIVCLAGGRGRIATAGELWYRYWELASGADGESSGTLQKASTGKVPVLYFAGTGPQSNWNQVSKQLRKGVLQIIRQNGVQVVVEKESSNTDANARWLALHAQERGWKKILLLTSTYHMKRARLILAHVLKNQKNPVEVETFSVHQEPFATSEWRTDLNGIRVTIFEYSKWLYYRWIWARIF